MTGIVVAFPKMETAKSIKNILVRAGYFVTSICSTGASAIEAAESLDDGMVICGYRLRDMIFTELKDNLPERFAMLLIASESVLGEYDVHDLVSISMPLKVYELIDTVEMIKSGMERDRKRRRSKPRVRNSEEEAYIKEAKELLMDRNHMSEDEAHRYIQKYSMDSGVNMAEMAQMILSAKR